MTTAEFRNSSSILEKYVSLNEAERQLFNQTLDEGKGRKDKQNVRQMNRWTQSPQFVHERQPGLHGRDVESPSPSLVGRQACCQGLCLSPWSYSTSTGSSTEEPGAYTWSFSSKMRKIKINVGSEWNGQCERVRFSSSCFFFFKTYYCPQERKTKEKEIKKEYISYVSKYI